MPVYLKICSSMRVIRLWVRHDKRAWQVFAFAVLAQDLISPSLFLNSSKTFYKSQRDL